MSGLPDAIVDEARRKAKQFTENVRLERNRTRTELDDQDISESSEEDSLNPENNRRSSSKPEKNIVVKETSEPHTPNSIDESAVVPKRNIFSGGTKSGS